MNASRILLKIGIHFLKCAALSPQKLSRFAMAAMIDLIQSGGFLMRLGVAMAVACLLSTGMAVAGPAWATMKKPTNIEAQGLRAALQSFAKERDVQIVYRSDVVGALKTNGAAGELTVEEALTQLLKGTGLTFQYLEDKGVTIVPLATQPQKSEGNSLLRSSRTDERRIPSRLAQADAPASAVTPQSDGDDCDESNADGQLTCVTITSQRRTDVPVGALGSRSELNTPFSTSTIDSEDLASRMAYSLTDVFANDASVSRFAGSDYTVWSSSLSVRGLAIDANTGLKMNGLPVWVFGVNMPLESMEEVQLLKGATGFMYGFGAPGGMVNYVTKKPTEKTRVSLDAGWRADQIFSQHADFGGRVGSSGVFGYRLNLAHENGATATDSDVARKAGSLALDAHLTDTLTATAEVLYQKNEIDRPAPYVFLDAYNNAALPRVPDSKFNPTSDQSHAGSVFTTVTGGLSWQLSDNWKTSTSLAHSQTELWYSQEYLTLLNPAGDFRDRTYDSLQFVTFDYAQALLEGRFYTGAVRHEIISGISYQKYRGQNGYSNLRQGFVNQGTDNLYAISRLEYTPNYGRDQPHYQTAVEYQRAAFISDWLHFSDEWSFLAGIRYSDYGRETWAYAFTTPEVFTITKRNYDKNPTTPTFALIYKPISGATAYASYTEALEPGTTVGATFVNANQALGPLTSKQYEIGLKWEQSRYSTAAALFRVDRAAGYGNAANVFVQDGILRYQGLELSGDVRLTPNLLVGASTVYLDDATYERTGNAWLIGRRVPGSTKFTATLQATYDVPGVPGLMLHADAKHAGSTIAYQNTASLLTIAAPSHTIFNVSASYGTEVSGFETIFRAGVQNLTDKDYWAAGANNVFVGAPRVFTLNAEVKF